MTTHFHDQLATFLAGRRWFAGKGRAFTVVHRAPLPWLSEHEPRMRIEIVTVQFEDGESDAYQLPIAYFSEPDPEIGHAAMATFEDDELGAVTAYDAVFVKSASDLLLQGFQHERKEDTLRFCVMDGIELPGPGVSGVPLTAEQSNTSLAFGDQAILKLFRRVSAGFNPDIEIHEALTKHGSQHVAPLLGWIDAQWSDANGEPHEGHLGMLQTFLRTAADGWDMALTSVRDLLVEEDLRPDEVGGDFAAEAERLGEATATVHRELAEVFGTSELTEEERDRVVGAMEGRLTAALGIVPELAEHEAVLRRRLSAFADFAGPITAQRIHGDLHLGQTLRTVKNWKIIDFEGEPAKPLPERVRSDSPLRDVAGMLRSFDYAAGATLYQFGDIDHLRYHADEWATRNREAFLAGYATGREEDASGVDTLLHAYEADKAVYEAVYETRNRPSWLPIPLHGIARIAAEE